MMKSTLQRLSSVQRASRFSSVPAVHQSIAGRNRFYKEVNVKAGSTPDKFVITLDGHVLKTPARNPLELPSLDLAMAIAAEWDAQSVKSRGIQPVNMPLMSLASTAIDQIQIHPETSVHTCMRYLPTDAALFITNETDRLLLAKQQQHLFPVIEWFKDDLKLELGVMIQSMAARINHPPEVVQKLEEMVKRMDPFSLACLQGAVLESKSLVLSLAFMARKITMEDMIAASRLEEEFQVEIWGVVEGGHDMDRLNNAVRLASVGTFMSLRYDDHQLAAQWREWIR